MRPRFPAIFMLVCLTLAVPVIVVAQTDSESVTLRSALAELLPELTRAEIDALITAGELSGAYGTHAGDGESVSVRLAPAYAAEIRDDLAALQPRIGVEALFLVDAPDAAEEITPELFRRMQAMSTMEGIEYYSASRDRMRILFHESYVIEGPDDRTRRPDPEVTTVPREDTLHVFQRDSSFGRNVLELTYVTSEEAVRLRMRNLTQMFYQGIIPAVGPGGLGLNLVVVPLGERVLFYGNSAASPITLLGMEARVQRSFYNRLVALYRWFVAGA